MDVKGAAYREEPTENNHSTSADVFFLQIFH